MPIKTLAIPTTAGLADATAAYPDGDEQHPGVLLYMDGFGVRPALIAMAHELSKHGYYVLVPNVLHRHGPAPVVEIPSFIDAKSRPGVFDKLLPMIKAHSTESAQQDAKAYLTFLSRQPTVTPGPVATVGYCWGGVLALQAAAARPERVAAVAAFHAGPMVTNAADSPHLLVAGLAAQFHLGHAEGDMTAEITSALDHALASAGPGSTSEVYPGTVHGFTMSDTEAFDPAARQLHWDRMIPLLDRALHRR